MKLDKQTKQNIAVVVLAVLLVGYIAYTIITSGKTAASSNSAKTSHTRTGINDSSSADGKNSSSEGVVPNIVFPGLDTPTPRRDPFYIEESSDSKAKAPAAGASKLPKISSITRNPLKPFNPFGPFKPTNDLLPKIGKLMVIPPEQPTLSGVIMGPNNVAIIKYGGKTYIANEGSFFAGKYRLLRVTKNSVVLQNGSAQLRIGLGG